MTTEKICVTVLLSLLVSVMTAETPPDRTVTGVVTDMNTGEPLAGAVVQIKGTGTGSMTDDRGRYRIDVPEGDVTLVFSYILYVTKEEAVGDRTVVNVRLEEDANELDDVVVVAYGKQKKEHIVSSIQTVKSEDLYVPSSSLSTGFAGKLAGVIAVQRNGQPGADQADFWIRGISTFGSATDPLIILDGVSIDANELNGLDPEIIESFSVLKDATATALYGSRGANGVMIVTTKSGRDMEKPIVNFRVETALSMPTSRPETVDAVTYMQMFNEAALTRGTGEVLYTQEKIDGTRAGKDKYLYPDVDWYDEMFKQVAVNENDNFNIRGGGTRVDYFMSATVRHEEGMMRSLSEDYFSYNNNYSVWRYAFQNNVNVYLTNTTKVSLRLNTQLRNTHGPVKSSEDIFGMIMNGNPADMPVNFPSDPSVNHIRWGGKQLVSNPVAEMVTGYMDDFQSVVNANLSVDQDLGFITEGLSASALVSFKNWSYTSTSRSAGYNRYEAVGSFIGADGNTVYELSRLGDEQSTTLSTYNGTDGDRKFYLQGMVSYDRTFGKHSVGAMLVYNQEETALGNPSGLFESLPRRKQSIAGRVNYGFDDRYLFEANFGYNGSENFAKGRRFGFFPSVAIGWLISEESFMRNLQEDITKLKLRASVGSVGNDNIGGRRFAYITTINSNSSGYHFGYTDSNYYTGIQEGEVGVSDLTWEKAFKMNIGLELGLWNELDVQLDFFKEKRTSIFMQRSTIPTQAGFVSNPYANYGKVNNQGYDLSVIYNKRFNDDWAMSLRGTVTYAKNEILEKDEPESVKGTYRSITGRSINTLWGLQAERLFTEDDFINGELKPGIPKPELGTEVRPGDIKYVDMNDDGVITEADEGYIGGTKDPRMVYGFGGNLNYKQWDFSFFFQGSADA